LRFARRKDTDVKKTAVFVVMMVLGIGLMVWAGVHNLRSRKLALEKAQENKVTLVPDNSGSGGTSDNASKLQGSGDDQPQPLKGKAAPAFTLVTLEGKKVSLSDYKGRPVLVNFWATWCAPCKLEMPWLEDLQQRYAGQGLVILGIASDEAPKNVIAATAKKLGVTYPVLLTDSKIETPYGGVNYMPESFYVDRSGKVLIETAGITDGQGGKDQIEANLKRLIASGAQ